MDKSLKQIIATARQPIDVIARPFQRFIDSEESSGIVLLVCTAVALVWANSPWAHGYAELWETRIVLGVGDLALDKTLAHWINDGLMAIFFFLVGLEIKREFLVGDLATPRQAALPIAAALGGMIVPAAIYALLNAGTSGEPGWGIPMATDIAFALGVLALLGRRVPAALTVFLAALAIVDDLGAVLVIAIFYTGDISFVALVVAATLLAVSIVMNRLGVRSPVVYGILGVAVWLAVLKSGVHATIAGVLLAATIPARTRINTREFTTRGRRLIDEYEQCAIPSDDVFPSSNQNAIVQALEKSCEQAQTPLQRLEHGLHKWVLFLIMPVFALANAGVILGGELAESLSHPVTLGVAAGLVFGKQIGITLFSWLAIRSGLGEMPAGVSWRHLYGAAWLGGIGFTMSLFVAGLAFGASPLLAEAKVGILGGSLIAGVVGYLLLRSVPAPPENDSVT